MYMCDQKTRLFTVLPLENRHRIALNRSVLQFIFFERSKQSRASLLSSAMDMVSNSCIADKNITVTGGCVRQATTSLSECYTVSVSKNQDLCRRAEVARQKIAAHVNT